MSFAIRTRACLFLVGILLAMVFLGKNVLFAQTPTTSPSSSKLSEIQNQIRDLESKITSLQGQQKTLSSQITTMNNQIRLTELRISSTKQQIVDLSEDIDTANKKISRLEEALDSLTKVLINRVVVTYEFGNIGPLQILLSSNSISSFVSRVNYLRIVQAHDRKVIYETQQAKNDYTNQKAIFEEKKAKVETLQGQLEGYVAQLDQDKKSKEALLEVTKNDEKKYQELLAKSRAEQSAIQGVIRALELKDGTPVKQGDPIAVVGNTGAPYCSTGPHLHFEFTKDGNVQDPNNYLRPNASYEYSYGSDRYDYYGTVGPRGDWNWPLDEVILVNQGYGSHGYARSFYPNGTHSGIDMESKSSSIIKAPRDGTLYKGGTGCGGASMNYAAVDHGGGLISWYWHVQ
ncbi:MAG: hypothetical protein A3J69_02315 [Candidatus Levybacteria bacterium RIFCSPHIGHO2_02_FULL_42_12]|nr:MAG: hypothetical protein A3J69_02315 [Candidatus Levybacteria bacterium RIFCSPHIGHO2_02_FULL_42_12]OGH42779.1 MAG: hypothetical protein A3B53_01545 [Candidatus Levybacteria bacterium RIFCSPLOWO2_01_FULL_42_15]